MALQIGKGLALGGAIDNFAGVILQGVVERDDGVFLDGSQGGYSK
jgi:hypothetical protein